LVAIGVGEPGIGLQVHFQLDVLAHGAAQHVFHRHHQHVHVHRFGIQRLAPGKGQQAMGQRGGAVGRGGGGVDVTVQVAGAAAGNAALDEVQRAEHAGQHVVEVMGQAAGQLADGFHLLRVAQCFLGAFAFGHLDMQAAVDRRQLAGTFGHAPFQAFVEFAQGFFGGNLGRHVGVGSEPVGNLAEVVANGQRPGEEPAVLAVLAAQREGLLPDGADGEGTLHRGADPLVMIGMVDRAPTQRAHGLAGGAGVVVPALVVPVDAPGGVGHPGELAHVVGQGAELLFALAQCAFGAHAFVGGPGAVGHFADERNVLVEPGARLLLEQHHHGGDAALLEQWHADDAADQAFGEVLGVAGGAGVVQHVLDDHQFVFLQVVEEVPVIGEIDHLIAAVGTAVAPVALDGGALAGGVDTGEQHPRYADGPADHADGGMGDGLAVVLFAQQVAQLDQRCLPLLGLLTILDLLFEHLVHAQHALGGVAFGSDVARRTEDADLAAGVEQPTATVGQPDEVVDAGVVDSVVELELAVALTGQGFTQRPDQLTAIVRMHPCQHLMHIQPRLLGWYAGHRLELGVPVQGMLMVAVLPNAD